MPTKMRAIILDRFGDEGELREQSVPIPAVGEGDVLIRIDVAGIGSWDREEREGHYEGAFGVPSTFPYILGWEGAGTVEAVGADVTRFAPGDRVYAASTPVPRGGFYAEYAVVDQEHVAPVPARLTDEQAGVLAWDALTATSGLDTIDARPGDAVMIFGASGGIGHLAVQLAKHRGLRVFAVASGQDGVSLAGGLGADVVVDGRRDDVMAAIESFAPEGLDGALVTAGGRAAEDALRGVAPSGRIAWAHGVNPPPSAEVVERVSFYDGDRSRAALQRLNEIIESSLIAPHVAQVFDAAEVAQAHHALRSHYVGKLALRAPRSSRQL
ncbi:MULTISPECIES: NADP-dependent oxidoreductase [Microbacterium]|uniref:NADP-dependent oxidoreductase n=1 Tax=Microbacterium TaxID=33882 RepID=UPI0025F35B91|nr:MULTISPECIES: NADP-dependent oxidoreductase [Microbacterium]